MFDGKDRIKLFPYGQPLDYPFAEILEGGAREVVQDIRLVPICMVYRTLDDFYGVFRRNQKREIEAVTTLDGMQCAIVKQRRTRGDPLEIRIYADINRSFLPVRYESQIDGRPVQLAFITAWESDLKVGWVPVGWSIVRRFDTTSNVTWADKAIVKRRDFNGHIDGSVFKLKFPVGTWVENRKTKERYLVAEGGAKRPIPNGD